MLAMGCSMGIRVKIVQAKRVKIVKIVKTDSIEAKRLNALKIFKAANLQTTVSALPADQKSANLPRHWKSKTKAKQRSLQAAIQKSFKIKSKKKTKKKRKNTIAEKRETIYIYKISFRPRLFTVFTTHKFLSLVIKTSTLLRAEIANVHN